MQGLEGLNHIFLLEILIAFRNLTQGIIQIKLAKKLSLFKDLSHLISALTSFKRKDIISILKQPQLNEYSTNKTSNLSFINRNFNLLPPSHLFNKNLSKRNFYQERVLNLSTSCQCAPKD